MRLIDADAFMKELNEEQKEGDSFYLGLGQAKKLLSEQTTIDPVRHGKWQLCDDNKHSYCTNCNAMRNIKTQIGWNYCPNCGAKNGVEISTWLNTVGVEEN